MGMIKKIKEKKVVKTNSQKPKLVFRIIKALICLALTLFILSFIALVSFSVYIVRNAPYFDPNALFSQEASIILDIHGNEFARVGGNMRTNVTFDDLPEVFIDALLAAEDARFFQHNGVDWGRFFVATRGQLRGNRAAGGASTITMQVVTNTQTSRVTQGWDGIVRKFTDVYLSIFQLEQKFTKEQIIEFYVNLPFLGCGAWGVEQAAQIFFGKSISEVNLVESATIVGMFNAPGILDPCRFPDRAEGRRNQILNLMVRHNKITEEEYRIARNIPMSSLLVEVNNGTHEMQGAIDTVIQEVIDRTGYNPHLTSMRIYSTIDLDQQRVINDIYNGNLHRWPNETLQTGIAVIDVHTGAISAIGAGRNRRGELSFNYATMISRHPGSVAKTMFAYGPAIEFLGWSPHRTVLDEPHRFTRGPSIRNWDNQFMGEMTMMDALAFSRNPPAVRTFQALNNRDIDRFVTNIGMTPEYIGNNYYINEAHSLGGFSGSNPVQMAAAHAAFARGGTFIEPHSFTRVIFNDTDDEYLVTPEIRRAMRPDTAHAINSMLMRAVTSGFHPASRVRGTDVAGKTGTSTLDANIIRRYRLPSNAIGDSWVITYSPDIVFAIWIGYDQTNRNTFLTSTVANRTRNNLSRILSDELFPRNSRF